MKIILFTIVFSFFINTSFAQNKAAVKSNTQSIKSIKVPDFADAELLTFYTSYHNNLIKYLKAVRQNNRPAIKVAFDKDVSSFDKIVKMNERASASAAEHRKLLDYLILTKPFIKEISQHPYVKELSAAYLKTYNKK